MAQEARKVRMPDELKDRTLRELLQEAVRSREPINIVREEEEWVTIEQASQSKPPSQYVA